MATTIQVEKRDQLTKGERNKLRQEGQIPGVVYGSKLNSTSIAVDEKTLRALLKSNRNGIIQMEISNGDKHPVMINEIQKDSISGNILHIDFHQINMDEPIKSLVFIEITGESKGSKEGGVQQVLLHNVEVRCLPDDLPASLTVDVSGLEVGKNLLVSELVLPKNVELLTDPTEVIVTVLSPQKEEAPEAVETEEAGAAAPEAAEAKDEEKAESDDK